MCKPIFLNGDNMFIYENGVLKIFYYRNLTHIESTEIIVYFNSFILFIKGHNLRVAFFEKNELHVMGNISEMKMENKSV